MVNSREIKKALTRAFKSVKFSVTTRNVLCETITVRWTGFPFIDQVKKVTDTWNTFEDHSDIQSDYFDYSGVRIEFERFLSDQEIEKVVPQILTKNGHTAQDGKPIQFNQTKYNCHFSDSSCYHGQSYWHNQDLKQYLLSGEISSKEIEAAEEVEELVEAVESVEEVELIKGDYVGGNNGTVKYIQIHWHEGLPCIEDNAKFSTFKSVHNVISQVYRREKDGLQEGCYIKLKFSVVYTDGEIYTGRLDLCAEDDDPTATDNVIKQHCTQFLDYQVKRGSTYTYPYTFDDADDCDKDIQALSQEWMLDDEDKTLTSLTSGISTHQYQQAITKAFNLDSDTSQADNSEQIQKYSQWVKNKIESGKADKIVSFDDWLEYQ